MRRHASLIRWLGPLTPPTRVPGRIFKRELEVPGPDGSMRVWMYRHETRPPKGSVLVSPGLHFLGPADVRFDRFCRVLARSGALVMAPFLPTYLNLDVTPRIVDELDHALTALMQHPDRPPRPPSLFSISFGSMPALRLASNRRREVQKLVVFGGFHSFERSIRFGLQGDYALGGGGVRKHDPLNAPVVVQNLLPFIIPRIAKADEARLRAAFRDYCARTWGRPEMKEDRAFEVHARAVAEELPVALRPLFLKATHVDKGLDEIVLPALERAAAELTWIDPVPHLTALPPTTLVHGRGDDVIPFEESEDLVAELRARGLPANLYLTGMYGHTGSATLRELAAQARAMPSELRALSAIVDALAGL